MNNPFNNVLILVYLSIGLEVQFRVVLLKNKECADLADKSRHFSYLIWNKVAPSCWWCCWCCWRCCWCWCWCCRWCWYCCWCLCCGCYFKIVFCLSTKWLKRYLMVRTWDSFSEAFFKSRSKIILSSLSKQRIKKYLLIGCSGCGSSFGLGLQRIVYNKYLKRQQVRILQSV